MQDRCRRVVIVSHGSGVVGSKGRGGLIMKVSVYKSELPLGNERQLLCDPGVQSHAFYVSSVLIRFVRHPEQLGGAASASGTAAATGGAGIVAVAALERAGVAADAVCGRAARRRLQAEQRAGVLRRRRQDGASGRGGQRGGLRRSGGRTRGAPVPAG